MALSEYHQHQLQSLDPPVSPQNSELFLGMCAKQALTIPFPEMESLQA
jgi:hypothetical protein